MKKTALRRQVIGIVFAAAVCLALAAPAAWAVAVPAGTRLSVRLQESLSSGTATTGQAFTGVLNQPLVVGGKTVAPKGATVYGKVTNARPSGRLKTPGSLSLRLTGIDINGKRHALTTYAVGRTASSHKKRNIEMIGGGTGVGAAIGALAGGGKGAAIGAAAGAGAGTATAAATGKKDVKLPAETLLTFRLSRAAELP